MNYSVPTHCTIAAPSAYHEAPRQGLFEVNKAQRKFTAICSLSAFMAFHYNHSPVSVLKVLKTLLDNSVGLLSLQMTETQSSSAKQK